MGAWDKLIAALTLLLLSGGIAAAGCPGGEGAVRLKSGTSQLVYRTVGEIRVGEHFDIEVCIAPVVDGGSLMVEATMPAHGHGMNYEPVVQELEPGLFVAEGFILHMPGLWRLRFIHRTATGETIFTSDQVLQ